MPNRSDYFNYLRAGYEREAGRLEEEILAWKRSFSGDNALLGFLPTRFPLHVAAVAAFLYEQGGAEELAHLARRSLLRYREFTSLYPPQAAAQRPEYQDGVPPLDTAFDPVIFAAACRRLKPLLSPADEEQLASLAADSLQLIWRFPEWGGHNRAMLRAASLACCAQAFPSHPKAQAWTELADELAEESWGRWSIEDTMMYQAHWLRASILYAEARAKREFTRFLQPPFYLKAIVQLLSPLGILPDFGDSHWLTHSHWEWLALLEWGARQYRDPEMRWAAERLWELQRQESPNLYASLVLTLACEWCDDSLSPQEPRAAPDVLDDLVMKKLVYRSGWDSQAAYACVNYRDEGDYGRISRDYLRTNLAVSAEKMHHGHADEGSFSMLVHQGSLLLHESGYREDPPDGVYRADLYHNRVIWRPGARLPGQGTWECLHDNGHYKAVRSERLYQSRLCGVDVGRVRISDENQGLSWDRSLFFVPELPCWLVVDTLQAQRTAARTLGLLWWLGETLEQNGMWTKSIVPGVQQWHNQRHTALWLALPEMPGQANVCSTEVRRRSFQDEGLRSSLWSGEHRLGRSLNFVSLLWPRPYSLPLHPGALALEVVPAEPAGSGVGVRLCLPGAPLEEEILLIVKNDLTAGFIQEDIRPRTDAQQGKLQAGGAASDAAFFIVRRQGEQRLAGFLNGTFLEYQGQALYQGLPHGMFQEDRTHRPGIPARFRWEGEIK